MSKYAEELRQKEIEEAERKTKIVEETNLGFEKNENRDNFNKWYYNAILRGRELNEEKRDFNS